MKETESIREMMEKEKNHLSFTHSRPLSGRENYINQLFGQEGKDHLKIREALQQDGKEGVNVSAYEGRILQLFIHLVQAQTVLEIGTLYGYSTLWMAYALPEDGQVVSLESHPAHAKKAKSFLEKTKVGKKVKIIEGLALKNLYSKTYESLFRSCDLLFIDADKISYEKYLDWAELYLKKGALIIADNTFLFGNLISSSHKESYDEKTVEGMKNFNRRLSNFKKYQSIIIPTTEGLTVAKKIF